MATRIFHHLPGKEFINLKKFLAMKVSRPAPGRTRNTLCAKNEGKIRLPAGEQAGHPISANAELAAHLGHRVFIDRVGAQHLVFDLREVVGVEEIRMEEFRAHGFRMRVQGPGSQQGLSFGRSDHERPYNTAEIKCQALNAHEIATVNSYPRDMLIFGDRYAVHRDPASRKCAKWVTYVHLCLDALSFFLPSG